MSQRIMEVSPFLYEPGGQVTGFVDQSASGTQLQRMTFTYDGNGNRSTVADSIGALTTYGYDAKDRLVSDTTSGTNPHAYTYSYDGVDNRLTSSETGSVVNFGYDLSGRMTTSSNGGSYVYDSNGNQTVVSGLGTTVTMAYDKENRLVQHVQGNVFTTYTYDGDGLKRSERSGSSITTLIWDGTDYLQGRS